MAIKPILFNTEMVRAILDGRKKCTRRLVNPQPDEKHTFPLGFVTYSTEMKEVGCFGFGIDECGGPIQYVKPPYQTGDILYVRETWCRIGSDVDRMYFENSDFLYDGTYIYRADGYDLSDIGKWHTSIYMPKEAARIWLKVTDVRVERLQKCGEGWCLDIEKEGITTPQSPILYISDDKYHDALKAEFQRLWDSTIKKSDLDRYGWNANPYVWVILFERCEKPEGV